MQKPDVDLITGLSPAISIEQKTTSKNPRSTVGTVTEIYDYMRLLWARVGIPYSPATGLPIESQTVSQMVDRRAGHARGHPALSAGADRARPQGRVPQGAGRAAAAGLPAGQGRRQALRARRGAGARQEAASTRSRSWSTAWSTAPDLAAAAGRSRSRPRSASPTGCVVAENADSGERLTVSRPSSPARSRASPSPEIEPRLFSFNSPYGACPACDGLGKQDADGPGAGRARPGEVGGRGRGRALVATTMTLVPADAGVDLQALRRQPGHALAASCRKRCAR